VKLSFKALSLCMRKFAERRLLGFDNYCWHTYTEDAADLSEESIRQLCEELLVGGWVDYSEDGTFLISALGQHILGMLSEPEVFILLENEILKKSIRVYIKNAYYLCLTEEINVDPSVFSVDLVPGFDEIVGAFVYAVYPGKESVIKLMDREEVGQENVFGQDFHILGKAWAHNREEMPGIYLSGNYIGQLGTVRIQIDSDPTRGGCETVKCAISDLVNRLTCWMFDRLSEVSAHREARYGIR